MKAEAVKWVESPLRGTKFTNICFDPSNRLVAGCSNKEVLLFNARTAERIFLIETKDATVGCYFISENQLVTVSCNGVVDIWSLDGEIEPSLVTSYATNCKMSHARQEAGEAIAVVEKGRHGKDLVTISEDGKLTTLCPLPGNATPASFSVSERLVAVCDGKRVRVNARDKHAKVKTSYHVTKFHVDTLGDANERVVFEGVHVRGDTVAAVLSIGRIFIWSDVSRLGVNRQTQSVHWHKSAAALLLTPAGGLFSGGGECVLCKWKLGKGAPSMLPRLTAPISQLVASCDDSLLCLLLDDNSLVVVDAAAMAVQTVIRTLSLNSRSSGLPSLLRDPLEPEMVVMGAREGCLQWLHPASSTAPFMMDVGLENSLNRDLPLYGVVQSFHSVLLAAFTRSYAVTVEEHSETRGTGRVRVWRRGETSVAFSLVYSQDVPRRLVAVSTYEEEREGESRDPLFLLSDESGRTVVLERAGSGGCWHIDPAKDMAWKGKQIRCASAVNVEGFWATAHEISDDRDAVVLWDLNERSVLDVLMVDGAVSGLQWTEGVLIASTSKAVVCWSTATWTLRWRVTESWGVRVQPAPVAWRDKKVVLLDTDTGSVRASLTTESPVADAIAFKHGDDDAYGILVVHPDARFSVLTCAPLASPRRRRLPSLRTSSSTSADPDPTPSLPPASLPSLKSLHGPAHMLPPLPLLAPSFINSCLLPPPQHPTSA